MTVYVPDGLAAEVQSTPEPTGAAPEKGDATKPTGADTQLTIPLD